MNIFLVSKYVNIPSNTTISNSMAFCEPTTIEEYRSLMSNQAQKLQRCTSNKLKQLVFSRCCCSCHHGMTWIHYSTLRIAIE